MLAVKELREINVEPIAREALADHEILHREVPTDTESGIDLQILAREHTSFEEYVQQVRDAPLIVYGCLS